VQQFDEHEIIRRAQNGDTKAFSVLMDRYMGYVFSLAVKISGNREDANDITQEVFVRIYKHLSDYRGES
jgi:RNA polymerase sigma-70 factor, ECF subfamily